MVPKWIVHDRLPTRTPHSSASCMNLEGWERVLHLLEMRQVFTQMDFNIQGFIQSLLAAVP